MVKKVISKKLTNREISRPSENKEETDSQTSDDSAKTVRSKKVCFFCQSGTLPSYTDIVTLRRYLTDRAKIVPKLKSGLCSKHQRRVTKQIKYARHLALLPFVPKV